MKAPRIPKIFDPAKLEVMTEPLSVRVEKLKGNTRMPIPLPPGEDGTPQGTNWSKDDIIGLEQWLVTEWAGGGMYAITLTDSTMPSPLKHDWEIFYNPQQYPEKSPPTLTSAAQPTPVPSTSSPLQQARSMNNFPPAFPNGLPNVQAQPAQQPFQPPQPQTYYVPQPVYAPPAPQWSPREAPASAAQAAALAAAEEQRRRYEEQLKDMQAQLQRAREEQLQVQHRQELERVEARMRAEQQAQNERFAKLEQLITASAQRPTGPDPQATAALEALKEQNRMLQQQAENAQRERDAERREASIKEMIQRQAEDSRRVVEAMQAQLAQQALQAAQNKGPDPMMMFLQENARQQIEAVKEQSRNAAAQMTQMQTFMMSPRDIMAMTKDQSSGLEATTRQITSTYQSILEMQRNAVEQILNLNQSGGSETVGLIKEGLERVSSFAERYVGGKTREAVTQQQSQAQLAQANAAAMQAQASAMATQAAMQARQQAQANAQPVDNGLNGPRAPIQPTPVPVGAPVNAQPVAQDTWSTGPVPPLSIVPPIPKTKGRTDEEWFGPILPRVIELRTGVARFIESISVDPPRVLDNGLVDGVEPTQAAKLIMQAAVVVTQNQIPISAMLDLLNQGRVADFMDVLLPEAPQPYRDDVTQYVLRLVKGEDIDADEDEDDDEDEGDKGEGDESGDQPAVEVAPPTPIKPTPRPGRARA